MLSSRKKGLSSPLDCDTNDIFKNEIDSSTIITEKGKGRSSALDQDDCDSKTLIGKKSFVTSTPLLRVCVYTLLGYIYLSP